MRIKQKLDIFFKYVIIKPSRLINFFLISLSKHFKLTKIIGKPITAMIEPINYCNLQCPLCPTGMGLIKRKKEMLSFEDFKKILDNLGDSIIHLRLWNWGEPLMNRELTEMIKYAKSKNIFVNTSTNSSFLTEDITEQLINSGLDQLIVSIDGASEQTYNKYRKNGNFNQVINSLKKFSELKKKMKTKLPEIKLQFIVMNHNEHEINKIKEIAKEVGADTLFLKTVGIMDNNLKNEIYNYLPKNKNLRRYLITNKDITQKDLSNNVCDYLWKEITVNVDGSVVPCCRDIHGNYVFGNIKNTKLSEIWNNNKIVNFRKQVLNNKETINICKFCSGSNKEFMIKEIQI